MTTIQLREKTVIFIDGSNFYAAARALGMDIDYARMRAYFAQDTNLLRVCYYTALPEDQEYSPLRPLIDWLDYNGYSVISKLTREFTDPETGKRRVKGNMDMEIALDMLRLTPHIDHAILFSGDGDFCRLLEDVQSSGVRVSVVSTTRTSPPMVADSLRRMADDFIEMENIREFITRPPRPAACRAHQARLIDRGDRGAWVTPAELPGSIASGRVPVRPDALSRPFQAGSA